MEIKTTLRIPEELHKKIKIMANNLGISVNEAIIITLEKQVNSELQVFQDIFSK